MAGRIETSVKQDPGKHIPVIAFAGWSGSGKTTLIEHLIPTIREKGTRGVQNKTYRVAVIKHDIHGIKTGAAADGTDSARFARAGADPVILCGPDGQGLKEALSQAETERPDLILIEGFKHTVLPRIGVCRKANGKGFPAEAEQFIAVVTDLEDNYPVPWFDMEDIEGIADFIIHYAQI